MVHDSLWAKPLVDEALAEVERGETMSLEEFVARINARMAAAGRLMATIDATPRAAADVGGILIDLHGRGGRAAADRQQAGFKASARSLARHPEMGRKRPDVGPDLRSVSARPCVLIYSYDRTRDTVFVLRVLHGGRRRSRSTRPDPCAPRGLPRVPPPHRRAAQSRTGQGHPGPCASITIGMPI